MGPKTISLTIMDGFGGNFVDELLAVGDKNKSIGFLVEVRIQIRPISGIQNVVHIPSPSSSASHRHNKCDEELLALNTQ